MNIIVGTAGHIDHGKTTLIKALTGTDTDRLPEEKKRGITIDLGFAELSLGDHKVGFVDVPGHERFIKNMLAGASGIDLVLLIIAADEGVMPQTREHFDICRLLGVQAGIVALTKADIADNEMLELVRLDAAELVEGSFLENAPVVAVSSTRRQGIDELQTALTAAIVRVRTRRNDQVTRLAVDRSFIVKGFGTVVTGTLASGSISDGDELELLPDKRKARVRGLQTHGRETNKAIAGQRVAINLAGIDQNEAARGMTLSVADLLEPTQMYDAQIEVLSSAARPLRSRQRVRVHIGTAEALARVHVINETGEIAPGATDLIQLRLESPVTAVMGERFIIRSYSPQMTIAGGTVIDPLPQKHRSRDSTSVRAFLQELISGEDEHRSVIQSLVKAAGESGAEMQELVARTGWLPEVIADALKANTIDSAIVQAGTRWMAASAFSDLKIAVLEALAEFHKRDPLSRGVARDILKEKCFRRGSQDVFKNVIATLEKENKLTVEQDLVRLRSHSQTLTADEQIFLDKIKAELAAVALGPPKIDEVVSKALTDARVSLQQAKKLLGVAAGSGEIIKVSDEFYFDRTTIDALVELLRQKALSLPNRLIDVPTFKDLAGVSRKFAIPLLEYFDRVGITKRAGDKRVIM